MTHTRIGNTHLYDGDALTHYKTWNTPTAIISDGPYGVSGFPGDPNTPDGLAEWYKPHALAWAENSTPATTLWFWNTEIGWALTHPTLDAAGWQYEGLHIWDKGIGHVAGNVNSETIRSFPVVTEVCARYSLKPQLRNPDDSLTTMQTGLRSEWRRSGLPLSRANDACGVKAAATRKYFTKDHLWYYPPARMMIKLAEYATQHGAPTTIPYFSLDGRHPLDERQWELMRPKWHHQHGITNVWHTPTIRGEERVKRDGKIVHTNQKPLELIRRIITASTDQGDTVWDPFAGLATVGVAANELGRECFCSEITPTVRASAQQRLEKTQTNK